ncbi:MAG TPA: two-component regulator propeller domain-containing protein [Prolixibacteraceae bacterium]|nr:two-component regulator propeller domain-containing protein [Prolixibacteraceae bacterium]
MTTINQKYSFTLVPLIIKYLLFGLLALGFFSSCKDRKNVNDNLPQVYSEPKVVPLNIQNGYKVNQLTGDSIPLRFDGNGDTAKTGFPFAVNANIINLDTMTPPVTKLAVKPAAITYPSNVKVVPEKPTAVPFDTSKLKILDCTEVHSDFVLINNFGDTIPTGKPIKIDGTKILVKTPPDERALPPGSKDGAIYNFDYLNIENGLQTPGIKDLLMDQNDRLWIGTWGAGISSYDGQSFRHYTSKEGFKCQFIEGILEDKNGNIWIASVEGLFKYDGENFTSYIEYFNGMNSVAEDAHGFIWVGFWSGVIKIDPREDVHGKLTATYYTSKEGLSSNSVNSAYADRSGNIWVGTWGGGVNKFDGRLFTQFKTNQGLSSNGVRVIYEDKAGNYWFGTHNGVNLFDGSSFTYFTERDGLSNNIITSFTEDQDGNLLLGSFEGVNILEKDSHTVVKSITHLTEKEGLSGKNVNVLLQDKTKNLWVGTSEGGISRLKTGSITSKYGIITNLSEEHGLINNSVSSVSEDHSGNLWLGTTGGLSRYIPGDSITEKETFYNYTSNEGLQSNEILSTFYDRQGSLWIGQNGNGVNKFDGKTFTIYRKPQGFVGGSVFSIEEDNDGNKWFATSSGVSRFDGHSFNNFTNKNGLINTITLALFKDISGDIWFGTMYGGVVKYHSKKNPDFQNGRTSPDGDFTIYTDKEGLSNNMVISIQQDDYGNMWFGTMEGLNRFDGESFTYFTEKEGLSDNVITSIIKDDTGNLLIGTARGLDYLEIYSGKEINNENKNDLPPDSFRIKKFGRVAGLKSTGFTLNNGLIDSESRVWMGTPKGVITFAWDTSLFNSNPPEVYLTGLDVNGRFIDFRKLPSELNDKIKFSDVAAFTNYPTELQLPYNLNHLTFHFVGIEWSAPENIKYSYRVEGLNDNWSIPSAEIKADYRNIRFGEHKFLVRAIGASGEWSEPFEFRFTIRPPIWFTFWAYLIYALLFAFGIFVIDRFQRRRLIERERQKTRDKELEQAKEIEKAYHNLEVAHDSLKSTQSQLIQSEKMASLGELTAGIAHEIQNPLNFVNNFSEVNYELLDDLKEAIANNDKAEIEAIFNDLKENESKVTSHGKRAESIVKGMLMHSRGSSGKKEPTDINALADEYLRLSYHGYRAKDKSFNADFKLEADESLPKVDVVPQDIGRVLLNLINNAFYAVAKRAKENDPPPPKGRIKDGGADYIPTVIVRTSSYNPPSGGRGASISVSDNGPGIPTEIKEKIFQPFFTTKSTGEGTGLGLSLSYDIVKAHDGQIKVESVEGEGTEFTIEIPLKS